MWCDIINTNNTSELFHTCDVISSVPKTHHNSFRRVVWYRYWQHVRTLSHVSCDIIGTNNTSELFHTCDVISSVPKTRHNSFTRIVWYHRYWQHVTTLSDVSYQVITARHFSFLLGYCIFFLWFDRELEAVPTTWAVSECHKYVSAWKDRGLAAMFGLQLKRCGRARTGGFWIAFHAQTAHAVTLPVNRPWSHAAFQPLTPSRCMPFNRSRSHAACQPLTQSRCLSTTHAVTLHAFQPLTQSRCLSTARAVTLPVNRSHSVSYCLANHLRNVSYWFTDHLPCLVLHYKSLT